MYRLAAWLVLTVFGLALGAAAQAPAAPLGRWLSATKRGVIEIYPCADKLCGKLVWLIEPLRRGAPAVDDKNPDPALRQRPLCGLTILGDFRLLEPQRWGDGWIYDPDAGKTYHATMTLAGETLNLRGYIGIPLFGETQSWTRPEASYGSC
ncbi:MAG: DUF2147 domain-containing protein [Stellaceae bacterium]